MAVSAAVTLAVLIIGIRRADRRHLANAPRSHSEAFARRLLLGVRYPAPSTQSARQEAGGRGNEPRRRNHRRYLRRPPPQRVRVREGRCPRSVGAPQEMADPQEPRLPQYRKEVMCHDRHDSPSRRYRRRRLDLLPVMGLRLWHLLVCLLLGFLIAATSFAPEIQNLLNAVIHVGAQVNAPEPPPQPP